MMMCYYLCIKLYSLFMYIIFFVNKTNNIGMSNTMYTNNDISLYDWIVKN